MVYVIKVPLAVPSDEGAHMDYVVDLATTGRLHVMQIGDRMYETHQPPLFYAFGAVMYKLFSGCGRQCCQHAIRSFSLLFHIVSALLCWVSLAKFLKREQDIVDASIAFYALVPCLLSICASVSNDSLAYLFAAIWLFWLSQNDLRIADYKTAGVTGLILGLGMLTKLTFAPFVILSMVLAFSRKNIKKSLLLMALIGAIVAIFLGPWIAHNYQVYGKATAESRLMGEGSQYLQHPSPAHYIWRVNWPAFLAYHYIPSEFWSFAPKVPFWLKSLLIGVSALGLAGLIRGRRELTNLTADERRFTLWMCLATYGMNIGVWMTTAIFVHQGAVRWVLGSFYAFAIMFCFGLSAWLPSSFRKYLLPLVIVFLVGLNLYLIVNWLPAIEIAQAADR